jgi:lysophospholipase L1-like esterase
VAVDHAPEFTARYEINAQGLRDDVLYGPSKTEGRTRFLVLGDSFTFGFGNDYEQIWPVLVERGVAARGRPVELVNAGVPDFDTRNEVLSLSGLFAQTTPDVVILVFLTNDVFTNDPLEGDGGDGAQRAEIGADAKNETLHSVTLLERLLMNNDRLYSALYRLTPRREYFEMPPTAELQSRLSNTSSLLREAARFCRERSVPLVVLSIPQQFQVLVEGRGYRYEGMDMHYIDHELERLAAQEGFRFISTLDTLAATYRADRADLYYRFDGHLNERGNRVVADYLADQLDSLLQASSDAPLR